MKQILRGIFTVLLAGSMLLSLNGCGNASEEKTDSSMSAANSAAESAEDSEQPITESNPDDMDYTLTYDSSAVPDDLAKAIARYFYAIDTQNYDLYQEQLYPHYRETMETMLQEQYGYGMETSLEQYHQTLAEYAGTETYTITGIEMAQAAEVLAEDFEENTDFVAEYLDAYTQVLGEEFTTTLQDEASAVYDIAITMTGEDAEGNALTIMDKLEILVVEVDGAFGILG